jgi:hypothetical protein
VHPCERQIKEAWVTTAERLRAFAREQLLKIVQHRIAALKSEALVPGYAVVGNDKQPQTDDAETEREARKRPAALSAGESVDGRKLARGSSEKDEAAK